MGRRISGETTKRGLGRATTTADEEGIAGGRHGGVDRGAKRRHGRGASRRRRVRMFAIAFHIATSISETKKARAALASRAFWYALEKFASATSDRDATKGERGPGAVQTATTGRGRKHRASLMTYRVRRVNMSSSGRWPMTKIERLQQAISDRHGLDSQPRRVRDLTWEARQDDTGRRRRGADDVSGERGLTDARIVGRKDFTMNLTRATVCCCSEARVLSRRHRVALVAD
jgi:hypothetical protein